MKFPKIKLFGGANTSANEATTEPSNETPATEPSAETAETTETSEETPEETPPATTEETPEESTEENTEAMADVITQLNACTEHIAQMEGTLAAQQTTMATLQASRTEDVNAAAQRLSADIVSAQGVPSGTEPEAEEETSPDAPKNHAEFMDRYNAISDSTKRGNYFAKWHGKFGQK